MEEEALEVKPPRLPTQRFLSKSFAQGAAASIEMDHALTSQARISDGSIPGRLAKGIL